LVKITRGDAGCVETFRYQGHELFDMSHLICDGCCPEHPIIAGKANIDHRRGVQRDPRGLLSRRA